MAAPVLSDDQILQLPSQALVPLLYERLLFHLRAAADCIDAGDLDGKSTHLERALAILFELIGGLDFRRGGEIAPRLSALYSWFTTQLVEIGATLDTELLARIATMVEELHAAWRTVATPPSPAPLP